MGTGRNICWQTPYLCYAGVRQRRTSCLGFLSGDACYLPRTTIGHCFMNGDFFVADCSQHLEKRFDQIPSACSPSTCSSWATTPSSPTATASSATGSSTVMKDGGTKLLVLDPSLHVAGVQGRGTGCPSAPAPTLRAGHRHAGRHHRRGPLRPRLRGEAGATASTSWPSACKEWTPVELAAEIAGVEAEDIRKAARLFASGQPRHHPVGPQGRPDRLRHPAGSGVCSPWAPSAATSDVPGGMMILALRLRHTVTPMAAACGTSPTRCWARCSASTPLRCMPCGFEPHGQRATPC